MLRSRDRHCLLLRLYTLFVHLEADKILVHVVPLGRLPLKVRCFRSSEDICRLCDDLWQSESVIDVRLVGGLAARTDFATERSPSRTIIRFIGTLHLRLVHVGNKGFPVD